MLYQIKKVYIYIYLLNQLCKKMAVYIIKIFALLKLTKSKYLEDISCNWIDGTIPPYSTDDVSFLDMLDSSNIPYRIDRLLRGLDVWKSDSKWDPIFDTSPNISKEFRSFTLTQSPKHIGMIN